VTEPEPFADAVRWPIDAEQIRLRLSDRLAQRLPALQRRLAPRLIADPAGSRLRRWLFTRSVTAGWAAFDGQDWDYLERIYEPGVEMTMTADMFIDTEGTFVGWPATRALLERAWDGFNSSDQRPTEIIDPGGRHFIARVDARATGEYSGIEFQREMVNLYEFGDSGLVARQWTGNDPAGVAALLAERRLEEGANG
jgi:hypothetical protein